MYFSTLQSSNSYLLIRACLALLLSLTVSIGWGQTDPTPTSTFPVEPGAASSTLPSYMAIHRFGTTAGAIPTTRTTAVANGDLPYSNVSANSGGWVDAGTAGADGWGILASGAQSAGALVIAINTTGRTGINISWTCRTILQQASYDNSIALQYRIGTTGTFTNIAGSNTYTSAGKAANATSETSFSNFALPAAAEGQSVVHIRWIYWNSAGSTGARDRISVKNISITAATPPTITTPIISDITRAAATSGGTITSIGSASVTTRGVVYSVTATNNNPQIGGTGVTNNSETGTFTTGAFTRSLTGLTANTAYSYAAYATNSVGTSYTTVGTFTTAKNEPTVQASNVSTSAIGTTTATVTFAAGTGGDGRIVKVNTTNSFTNPTDGVDAGTVVSSLAYTSGEQTVNVGSGTSLSLTGLTSGQTYWVRVYEYSNSGTNTDYLTATGTNNPNSFTTTAQAAPSLTTDAVASIGVTGATLNGIVTSDGNAAITARGFVYALTATNSNPTIGGTGVTNTGNLGGTTGAFNTTVSSLTANSGYSVRAYATNSQGTSYGTAQTFTTLKAEPTTQAASLVFSPIGQNSATISVTAGNGDGRILVIRTTNNSFTNPTDGTAPGTVVTSLAFTGTEQTVNLGTGTTVSVTGLATATQYFVKVYEYNNSGTATDYMLADGTANPGNFTTLAAPITVARYNFNGAAGDETTLPVTANAANATATSISRGAGVTGTALARAFNSTGFDAASASAAVTANDFYEVVLNASTSYTLSITAISGWARRSASGAPNGQFYYRIGNTGSFTAIGSSFSVSSATNGASFGTISTSGITDLQNVPASQQVFIRFYAWGGTSGGTTALGRSADATATNDALSFSGYVTFVPGPPVLTSTTASGVNVTSATTGGTVTNNGGASVTEQGVVYKLNSDAGDPTTSDFKVTEGGVSSPYSVNLTGLTAGTTYKYRAYAINSNGTGYGDLKTFTTLPGTPATQASAISFGSTTTSGTTVTLTGGNGAGRIVKINTSNSFTAPTDGNDPGTVATTLTYTSGEMTVNIGSGTTLTVSGLSNNTTYWVRAYEYNNSGTNTRYSTVTATDNPNSVTTPAVSAPTVTTTTVSAVTTTTATSGGNVTSDGSGTVSARGLLFGTSAGLAIGGGGVSQVNSGTGTGSFTSNLTGLTANTLYYYRSFATNEAGTSYGAELSFTTLKLEPTTQATAITISSTTASSVTFNWTNGNGDGRVVILSDGTITNPVDGTPAAAANTTYSGSGQQVVFNGSGSGPVTVNGLSNLTTYTIKVFEYNNSGTGIDFNVNDGAANNPRNFTTPADFISLALNSTYSQNFDGLGTSGTTWTNAVTVPAWYASRSSYTIDNGAATAGGMYNYGLTGGANRALGSLTSGSVGIVNYGLQLRNTTGENIRRVRVRYRMKQWRNSGNADGIDFYYKAATANNAATDVGVGASGFTQVSSLTAAAPNNGATSTALNGNSLGNYVDMDVTFTLASNLANNNFLFLMWQDATISGTQAGLSIDSVMVTWFKDAPDMAIQNASNGNATVSPNASLSFGTLGEGVNSDINLTLTNNGTQALSISSSAISGTDASEFEWVTAPPASIASAASETATIRYKRTTTGSKSALITITSNDAANPSFVINLAGTALEAATTISQSAGAASVLATSSSSQNVSSFAINDDALNSSADNLPTLVSQIVFTTGTGNTITDWSAVFNQATLTRGSTTLNGVISANTITFATLANTTSGDFGYIDDNASASYQLALAVNPNASTATKSALDNLRLVLQLTPGNVSVPATGSSFVKTSAVNTGSSNGLFDIAATTLAYIQQPTTTLINTAMTPAVTLQAVDANGFRDVDNTSTVSVSSSGTMTGDPLSVSLASGIGTVGAITHTVKGANLTLTASVAGVLTSAVSSTFSIVVAASNTGEFRATSSGDFSDFRNWQARPNGTSEWEGSDRIPTSAATNVVIASGANITVNNASYTLSTLSVESGATMDIASTRTITVNDGVTGTDAVINGTVIFRGNSSSQGLQLASGATVSFGSGSVYRVFGTTAAPIPAPASVSWDANSTFELASWTSSSMPTNMNQTFGHLILNHSGMTSGSVNYTAAFTNILGNLTITAAADTTREVRYAGAATATLAIGGNLTINGGKFVASSGTGIKTINVAGNLVLGSGGRIGIVTTAGQTINVAGNYIEQSGAIGVSNDNDMTITFNGANTQSITSANSGGARIPRLTVNKAGADTAARALRLVNDLLVTNTLTFTSGQISTGTRRVDLGTTGTITGEANGRKVVGYLRAQRTIASTAANTFGGVGVSLAFQGTAGGVTEVIRRTGNTYVNPTNSAQQSIGRSYKINPTVNAGAANATMIMSYLDDELNGIAEANLQFARSTDDGQTWAAFTSESYTRDGNANTVTAPGVNTFSDWTLQDGNNPLPVTLLYFQGKLSGETALLTWATSTEVNNAGFEIERSMDGKSFDKIGYVKGNGTTNQRQKYSFVDAGFAAQSYYRLKQIDFDGKYEYSPVILVKANGVTAAQVKVVPNPVAGTGRILFTQMQPETQAQILLVSADGKVITTYSGEMSAASAWFERASEGLAAGTYLLQGYAADQTIQHRFVVKR